MAQQTINHGTTPGDGTGESPFTGMQKCNANFTELYTRVAAAENAIALKAPIDSPTFTGTVNGISKAMVGLGSVNNTSDADKPVSTAQATAIAAGDAERLKATDLAGDFVSSGLATPVPFNTLDGVLAAGVAYVNGKRVTHAGGTYTYQFSSDTYVDLSDAGVLTRTAVANGAAAPSLAAGSMRLEKVVTDGTKITSVSRIASLSSGITLRYVSKANFPVTGKSEVLYVADDTGMVWRWHGSAYQPLGWGVAGTSLVSPEYGTDVPVGGLPCEMFGASPSASAAINTTAIQTALNIGGRVTLFTAGTFDISSTLIFYNDTELVLGPKTILRKANGMHLKLMRNEHYSSTVVTCTNGITGTLTGAPVQGYAVMTADFGANAHGFTSTSEYALFKGDTNGNFNGIFQIYEVTSSTVLKFLMATSPNSPLPASAGTVTCAKANANIHITGGMIDGNGANNTGISANDNHALVFNKVRNATVSHQSSRLVDKYAYTFCNAVNTFVHDITAETSSDAIHFCGPCWTSVVKDVRGMSGDDMVAFTTDNAGGFEAYDLPDGNGSFDGIEVDTIRTQGSTLNRMCLLAATGGFRIRGARVSNLYADSQAHCGVMLEGQPGNTGYWDDVTVDGVRGHICQTQNAVYVDNDGTKIIGSLTIRNIYPEKSILSNCVAISGGTATTIRDLLIENVVVPELSRVDVINFNGSTLDIKRAVLRRCSLHLDQANAANNKSVLYSQGAIAKDITLDNCTTGGSGTTTRTSFLATINAPAADTVVKFLNCTHTDNSQVFDMASITNPPKFVIRGLISAGICVAVPTLRCTIDIADSVVRSGTNNKAIAYYGTTITNDLHWHNVQMYAGCASIGYGNSNGGTTTSTFNILSSDATLSVKSDTANTVFNFSKGCIWDDTRTTNPGLYCKGPTAEARLAA